eukprot:TRINITY_DN8936_c0_g1_i5.p2 TRINITY_DN8936_c0_g1~~TRINITY_DN8936_c0_g1_i5.p2  ORF type:complete len:317 (-),score=66.49 TRINITY_DN8936_c0_g1_i5:78-1028(-)
MCIRDRVSTQSTWGKQNKQQNMLNRGLERLLNLSCNLSFGIASNFSQKSNYYNQFNYAVSMLPHPDKLAKGGEDAYYANSKLLAVADGVGGWNDHGVDPAKYSRELCRHIETLWNEHFLNYLTNPKQLIIDAAQKTKAQGSSTLAIVTIDDIKPVLYSSYIGDSGYNIYRPGNNKTLDIAFVSEEQQKSFNFPYQIGSVGDPPTDARKFTHQVKDKDIIVIGSDGLFDNLDEHQIKLILEKNLNEQGELQDIQNLAKQLGNETQKYAMDKKYMSPFAKRAAEQGLYFQGGKLDDITLIIGQINFSNATQQNAKADL